MRSTYSAGRLGQRNWYNPPVSRFLLVREPIEYKNGTDSAPFFVPDYQIGVISFCADPTRIEIAFSFARDRQWDSLPYWTKAISKSTEIGG
jgi:hypothetical protein